MKKHLPTICWIVSVCFVLAFVVKTALDHAQYVSTLNSAPFRLWVLFNALLLLVPAIAALVIGFIAKKRR